MKLILALALLGPIGGNRPVCTTGNCSTSAPISFDFPQYSAPPVYYIQPPAVQYLEPVSTPAPAAKPALQWHRIKLEGKVISVLGTKVAPGKIDFEPEDQPPGWRDQIAAVVEPEPTPKPAAVDASVTIESTPKVLFDQTKLKAAPDPDPGPPGAVVPAKSLPIVGEAWRFNGVNSSQISNQGLKAVGPGAQAIVETVVGKSPQIDDDSGKFSVSVIGSKAATTPVIEAFTKGPIAEQAGQLKVRAFEKTDPLVKDIGLVADGEPDVVVQSPDGTVKLRLKDFSLGAEGLKNELVRVGAVRKANASYDAKKDPGVEAVASNVGSGVVGALLAGGGVLMIASRRRKSRGR